MVVVGLVEPDVVLCADGEVTGIDVVTLHYHFENLWLVDLTFLHEVDDFILDHNSVIDEVLDLNLELVLKLSLLGHDLLVFSWLCEVLIVLGKEMHFTDVSPRVPSIPHRVLGPESDILASSQKVDLVNLLLKMLPVESMRKPCKGINSIEETSGELPAPHERVDEEHIPGQGNECIVHHIWVLEVNSAVLDVVARVEQHLSISAELKRL